MTDEITETDKVVDIDTWLGNPLLMYSHMHDQSSEHALGFMPEVSMEEWWIVVVEPTRTLMVRQSHPGSEDSVGLLFSHLSTGNLAPTARALDYICPGSTAAQIESWLQFCPDGIVIADLDKDQQRFYALA